VVFREKGWGGACIPPVPRLLPGPEQGSANHRQPDFSPIYSPEGRNPLGDNASTATYISEICRSSVGRESSTSPTRPHNPGPINRLREVQVNPTADDVQYGRVSCKHDGCQAPEQFVDPSSGFCRSHDPA